jgi:hypothetical protein
MALNRNLIQLLHQPPKLPYHLPYFLPISDSLRRKKPMLEGIFVALWCAGGQAAMHSAFTVRHRWGLAWAALAGFGMASFAQVHG